MADLREGEMLPVTANGIEVVLAKVRGNVFAFQAVCSHQEAWLDGGWVHPESMEIECPLHEGRFDVRTGEPTQPPPTEPLKMFAVLLDGDDILVSTSE